MVRYKKLSVIIPAYNEEATIREVVHRVSKVRVYALEKEIIVVDDGSKDKTREILKALPNVRAILHEKNKGKGGAIKTGIAAATGDILVIQDADLEYDPGDYPHILRPILAGDCEFVMGSRFVWSKPKFFTENGDPFFSHYIANVMIILITNLLYGCDHTDYEGCYKAFTKKLADSIPIVTDGFDFDNELVCKSLRRGYRIVEVPIRYRPRMYSEGKKIGFKDGLDILKSIIKWRFLPF